MVPLSIKKFIATLSLNILPLLPLVIFFWQFPIYCWTLVFSASCLFTLALPYDLLNLLIFPADCHFSRTLTIFRWTWYSTCYLPFFLKIYLFLPLNINPCHLPYFIELLTFAGTCQIFLSLFMIRGTPIFFSLLLYFSVHWILLNTELLLPKFKFGCTQYLYNLFIFSYYCTY